MVFQNSGIFIINKPFQWTSNDVIRKIEKQLVSLKPATWEASLRCLIGLYNNFSKTI